MKLADLEKLFEPPKPIMCQLGDLEVGDEFSFPLTENRSGWQYPFNICENRFMVVNKSPGFLMEVKH